MRIFKHGTISSDWFGEALPVAVSYSVGITSGLLRFGINTRYEGRGDHLGAQGEFYEGLWERDVAELFIAARGSSEYIELNFNPVGAWWFQRFSGPRVRRESDYRPTPVVESIISGGQWDGSISLKLGEIGFDTPDSLMFNVCLILGDNPRRYISASGGLENTAPDFHRRELFRPLN